MDRERGDGEESEMGIGGAQGQGAPAAAVDVSVSPAKEIVDAIVLMGISRPIAEMAVRQTGADTAESAIAWVFENEMGGVEEEGDEMYQDYKMVFVVNASLPMTPGKMAAQVGHAALGIYQDLISKQDLFGGPLLQWNENGSRKIVLQCETTEELNELASNAEKIGLPFSLIQDAGHTQIPAGSQTVLAVFGVVKEVDKVTGTLKLLP